MKLMKILKLKGALLVDLVPKRFFKGGVQLELGVAALPVLQCALCLCLCFFHWLLLSKSTVTFFYNTL